MTEEEQIAQIKDWWQRNGKPLLVGGVLAIALVAGWNLWDNHKIAQAQNSGALFQQMLETTLAGGEPDLARATELAGQIRTEFADTHYAQYSSLLLAKLAVEANKLDDAVAQLQPLLDKPADASVAELARQRLARVLAAQGKLDEALALLAGEAGQAWQASRAELEGDLLLQLGRQDEALAAYLKAKAALHEEAAVGSLQMKLDDLAKEDA